MVNITSQDRVLVLYIPSNGNTPATGAALGLVVRSTHDNGPLLAFTLQDAEGLVLSQGLMMVGAMPADAGAVQYNREIDYKEYGNE